MVKKIIKESADGRRVIQVTMDIEVPRDFSESDLRGYESGNPGKIYTAIGSALDKVGGAMAGDYIELVTDHTDTYEGNGYFDEESSDYKKYVVGIVDNTFYPNKMSHEVTILATSFGDLMDKFWSTGEYAPSDVEISHIYDEDGNEYDLETGDVIL